MSNTTQQAALRAEFEAWYCEDAIRQGGPKMVPEDIARLRDGDSYGSHHVMLNGKWEGWQAARSAAPDPAPVAPTDLHGAIMNLQVWPKTDLPDSQLICYKLGARDARHAAAELVSATPADKGDVGLLREELVTSTSMLMRMYENLIHGGVRDTASATRMATGLLSPAIERLERAEMLLQRLEGKE